MMPEPDREIKERNTLFLIKKVVILLPNYDSFFWFFGNFRKAY
jgi:hypothetical protein